MPWILNFKNGILTLFKLKFQNDVEDAKVDIQAIRWQALKNHIHCSEMLNAIQERKRCNRLVIIPWRNTIPFQELIGDHFGVGIISGSIWGSFQGWGSFHGRDHFGGCTNAREIADLGAYWSFECTGALRVYKPITLQHVLPNEFFHFPT